MPPSFRYGERDHHWSVSSSFCPSLLELTQRQLRSVSTLLNSLVSQSEVSHGLGVEGETPAPVQDGKSLNISPGA